MGQLQSDILKRFFNSSSSAKQSIDIMNKHKILRRILVGIIASALLCNNICHADKVTTENRTSVLLKAGGDKIYSDFTKTTAINMPADVFYRPYKDTTKATNLNLTNDVLAFTSINKNGMNILYVASNGDGVAKTTNGGINWTMSNNGLTNLRIKSLLYVDNKTYAGLYAGTNGNGIFKSTDDGASWQEFNNSWTWKENIIALYSFNKGKNAGLYAIADGAGIYRCNANTPDWQKVRIYDFSGTTTIDAVNNLQSVDYGKNIGLYAGTLEGVYKSTDGGSNWTEVNGKNRELYGVEIQSLYAIYSGTNAGLYAGTNEGVFKTTDGGATWEKVLSNKNIKSLYSIDNGENAGLYAGTDIGIFKTIDGGNSWVEVSNGLSNLNILSLYPVNNGTNFDLYAGATNGNVFKTGNGGSNWLTINNELAIEVVHAIHIIDQGEHTGLYVATKNHGGFKSTDGGANWEKISNGLTSGALNIWSLCSIDSGPNAGLYALVYGTGGVFKSIDGGLNWQQVTNWSSVLDWDSSYVVGLQSVGSTLYAITSRVLLTSINGGASWQKISTGLSGLFSGLYSISGGSNPGLYITIETGGIFASTDGANTWTDFNFNGTAAALLSIDGGSDIGLYAVTNNNQLLKYNKSATLPSWTMDNTSLFNSIGSVTYSLKSIYNGINVSLYAGTDRGLFKMES
jgi:photosystem II stability/assembly factor-like uncharacterized protein